jgi:hypothetical protein
MADQSSHRSRSQIEADLAATRARLSANLEALIGQVHPKTVKQRQVTNLKTLVSSEINNVTAGFRNENGDWRIDRLAMIAGSVVGTVVVVVVLRAIVHRGKKKSRLQ